MDSAASPAQYTVSPEEAGVRLDHYLAAKLPELSRSRVQALIKEGHARLEGNAVKPSEKVRAGNQVLLEIPAPTPAAGVAAEEIALSILYEDADLIVLDKPAGMVVHPAAGNPGGTVVNALLHHCGALSVIGGEERPGIVHRLDKDTSGCLVVAKNDLAHQHLSREFAQRKVSKIYLALASGRLPRPSATITAPIARHPVHRKKMAVVERGRTAKTDFRRLKELPGPAVLLECTLHTGRTHQIRVHLKHLGNPLLGDALYGKRGVYPRQMLHAWKLGFTHPRTGERLAFEAPIPEDFRQFGAIP